MYSMPVLRGTTGYKRRHDDDEACCVGSANRFRLFRSKLANTPGSRGLLLACSVPVTVGSVMALPKQINIDCRHKIYFPSAGSMMV